MQRVSSLLCRLFICNWSGGTPASRVTFCGPSTRFLAIAVKKHCLAGPWRLSNHSALAHPKRDSYWQSGRALAELVVSQSLLPCRHGTATRGHFSLSRGALGPGPSLGSWHLETASTELSGRCYCCCRLACRRCGGPRGSGVGRRRYCLLFPGIRIPERVFSHACCSARGPQPRHGPSAAGRLGPNRSPGRSVLAASDRSSGNPLLPLAARIPAARRAMCRAEG